MSRFKEDVDPVETSDIYYDLFDGGYIDPVALLSDPEDAKAVCEAMKVIELFVHDFTDSDLFVEC